MELESYLDLYVAEVQDNLRLLNQSLLALEVGGDGSELTEAFRAAHTIKGTAAMMGFSQVVEVAHALEDLLEEIRRGRRAVDSEVIDELLAAADLLERANDQVVARTAPDRERVAYIVRVEFEADCILKAARAAVVERNVGRVATVIKTIPASAAVDFDELYDGEFQLFVGAEADTEAIVEAARRAGEVARVEIEEADDADIASALEASLERGGAGAAPATGTRSLEVGGRASEGAPAPHRLLRISAEQLARLGDGIGDLGVISRRLEEVASRISDPLLVGLVDGVRRRVTELEQVAQEARLAPVGDIFHRFPRLVRDTAAELGKRVDFRIEGREIEADRRILEEVIDPLLHLIRNAVAHGLEGPEVREAAGKRPHGQLVLRVSRERSSILIEVEDDGRGIERGRVLARARSLGIHSGSDEISDDQLLRLLGHPGLSTADAITGVSGRGVGLDAVVSRVRALGGAVTLRTDPGQGTTFSLRLPVSLALTEALRIRVRDEDYAIPLTHVAEVVALDEIEERDGGEVVSLRGEALPLIRLGAVLERAGPDVETAAVIVEVAGRRYALGVDELVGRERIVIKNFISPTGILPIFIGAALRADGRPVLVLDPVSIP